MRSALVICLFALAACDPSPGANSERTAAPKRLADCAPADRECQAVTARQASDARLQRFKKDIR